MKGVYKMKHKVHCVKCGWVGLRVSAPLGNCKKCGSYIVWTFTGKTKPKIVVG